MSALLWGDPFFMGHAALRFLRSGLVIGVLLAGTLWAQTVAREGAPDTASIPSQCDSLAKGTPHADTLRKVCEYAVSLPRRIPNFTCEQRTARYLDGEAADVVTAEVSYLDGKESYRNIKSNGQPVSDVAWLNSHTWSTGQFGADIRGLFDSSNDVSFQLDETSSDTRILAFHYEIAQQDVPFWRLHIHDKTAAPPYHGEVRIDKKTGELRQLQLETTVLPDDFPLRSADLLIDYGNVTFGDGSSFLLPLKTVVNASTRGGRNNRNVLEFHNCHKFRAMAHVMP
jgi:hypothetical protein